MNTSAIYAGYEWDFIARDIAIAEHIGVIKNCYLPEVCPGLSISIMSPKMTRNDQGLFACVVLKEIRSIFSRFKVNRF